jgi:hypothetical protein
VALEDCLTNNYVDRFRGLMRRLEKRKTASHSWTILQQALALNQVNPQTSRLYMPHRYLKKSRLLKFCYVTVTATSAAFSKGIFAVANNSTIQTSKAGSTYH